jgi:hypothetical protein
VLPGNAFEFPDERIKLFPVHAEDFCRARWGKQNKSTMYDLRSWRTATGDGSSRSEVQRPKPDGRNCECYSIEIERFVRRYTTITND